MAQLSAEYTHILSFYKVNTTAAEHVLTEQKYYYEYVMTVNQIKKLNDCIRNTNTVCM